MFATHETRINAPIGIGVVLSFLIVLGSIYIIYKLFKGDSEPYQVITLTCAILTFLGANSMTFNLPLGFFSFRFWLLFALFGSILAAEGVSFLTTELHLHKETVIILAMILILLTSAVPKYMLNTMTWNPGLGWNLYREDTYEKQYRELLAYAWLTDNLPSGSRVFSFTDNAYVLGFDMDCCAWQGEEDDYRLTVFNSSPEGLHSWLRENKYEYMILTWRDEEKYGNTQVRDKVVDITHEESLYYVEHYTPHSAKDRLFVVFRIL